ncbi:uncharacterized protein LOC126004469 [Suncus etruscus]|uniref:uncharacterized protein LOC126004469 n=1 Tax=Suncus etruscus TaxID=109475 RepID=UPI00210F37E9|nr:uncharacterized protein LOC126004469 [Suncus etruscus]
MTPKLEQQESEEKVPFAARERIPGQAISPTPRRPNYFFPSPLRNTPSPAASSCPPRPKKASGNGFFPDQVSILQRLTGLFPGRLSTHTAPQPSPAGERLAVPHQAGTGVQAGPGSATKASALGRTGRCPDRRLCARPRPPTPTLHSTELRPAARAPAPASASQAALLAFGPEPASSRSPPRRPGRAGPGRALCARAATPRPAGRSASPGHLPGQEPTCRLCPASLARVPQPLAPLRPPALGSAHAPGPARPGPPGPRHTPDLAAPSQPLRPLQLPSTLLAFRPVRLLACLSVYLPYLAVLNGSPRLLAGLGCPEMESREPNASQTLLTDPQPHLSKPHRFAISFVS